MTTHVPDQTATPPVTASVPPQAPPAEPTTAKPVIDHVHAHSVKCYWDFLECRWQCSDD